MKTVFLSRLYRPDMPLYGGRAENFSLSGEGLPPSWRLTLTGHAGTHIDFPAHVHPNGRALENYPAESFVFRRPALLKLELAAPRYIEPEDLRRAGLAPGPDLILLKTGEARPGAARPGEAHWRDNPGLSPAAAELLKSLRPPPRCLGVDFISLNRWPDREPGRLAHRILLAEPEILIIEDLDLSPLGEPGWRLERVTAAPLRFEGATGAGAAGASAAGASADGASPNGASPDGVPVAALAELAREDP